MTPEEIAKVCHNVNRAYCTALGDDSLLPWEESPAYQRHAILQGVQYHIANPDAGPQAGHESWLAHKQAEGWTYGPKKDAVMKEHPCMVPFHHLHEMHQAKDYIFHAIVHNLKEPNDVRELADTVE